MTGEDIVGTVLAAYAPFIAAVAEGNFDYWDLPQGTGLPSVLLDSVSRQEQQRLAPRPFREVTQRIQATVRANSGDQRATILGIIRDACRDQRPTIAGVASVSILLAGDGPNFKDGDAAIYIGSTDLRVSFVEPA